jgi:hypothetical protein
MAARSLKLLSKNRLDDWSIAGCIRLSCLNFWTKVCLPEFFEITRRANTAEIKKTQEISGKKTEEAAQTAAARA